jgi:hypothetical protein
MAERIGRPMRFSIVIKTEPADEIVECDGKLINTDENESVQATSGVTQKRPMRVTSKPANEN